MIPQWLKLTQMLLRRWRVAARFLRLRRRRLQQEEEQPLWIACRFPSLTEQISNVSFPDSFQHQVTMNTSTSSSKKGAAPTSRSSSSKPAGKTFSIGSLTRAFSVTTTLENVPFLPSPIIIKSRAMTMFASPVGLKLAAVAKAATKKPAVQRKRRTAWTPQVTK